MPFSSNASTGKFPGLVLKAWVKFDGTTGAVLAQFNVSGVTKAGTGDFTVNFASPMASAKFITFIQQANESNYHFSLGAKTVNTSRILSYGQSVYAALNDVDVIHAEFYE